MNRNYQKGFLPYALAAFLIGITGGFSTLLGPAFVQALDIDYNNTTWTALAQAMSTAACAPILGKLGDKIGRRTTLLAGLAVFTLGNALSAVANSLFGMLIARFVVGIGTAAVAPVILAYIATEFPHDRVAKGFSLYMLISSASVVLGPAIGGQIIDRFGWRVMQWLCTAICVIVLLVCLKIAKKDPARQTVGAQSFDVAGAVAVFLFFSLLLCLPAFGQNFGWRSAPFLGILPLTLIALIALIAVERKAEQPLLNAAFMRNKRFLLSIAALFLTQGLMQANMTDSIIFMRYIRPLDTTVSAYAISVMYIAMSLGAVFLGLPADRFEPKYVLSCSLLFTLVGCAAQFFFTETTSAALLMFSLGMLGLGLGGNASVFMKIVLSGLPSEISGIGAGIYGLFRDLAAPFGVAVFVPMFTNRITALTAGGATQAAAAVSAVHSLAVAELLCVLGGIAIVLFLPKIHEKGDLPCD